MVDSNSILPPGLEHLAVPSPTEKKSNRLGQEDFLDLMLTQIRHQDPLNPMESAEFVSQLAQFGTVNGITELQSSFESLASSLQSNQALQASSLVGHSVLVPGNILALTQGAQVNGAVDLSSSTDSLKISIQDASGQTVRQIDMGIQPAGLVNFVWDGLDDSGNPLPAGNYSINATASINGEVISQATMITAKVESVTLSKNGTGPFLNLLGFGSVNLSEVREVM